MLIHLERGHGAFRYTLERNRIHTPRLHIEIGGAPLLPALGMAQNRNTTVVVVDPIANRLTKPLVSALEMERFDEIPTIIRSISEYDEVPKDAEPLIADTYRYYWENAGGDWKKAKERLLLVPERIEDFDIKGKKAESVSFVFPNPYIVAPSMIIENGLRLLVPGGTIQVMTENTDFNLDLREELSGTDGIEFSSQLIQRPPNSVPTSLYDIIRNEPFRYLTEVTKLY